MTSYIEEDVPPTSIQTANMAARLALGVLALLLLMPTLRASTINSDPVSVPGTSVIFDPNGILSASQLAFLGSNGSLGATPAVEALSFVAGEVPSVTFSASGLVGCCSIADIGPDGYAFFFPSMTVRSSNILSLGPISGFVAPVQMALVGVFTNGLPSGPAPASFNYSGGLGQTLFSPLLDQVFFIGDGLTGTGSGTTQTFNVPTGATELWLGFADAFGFVGDPSAYGDNPGTLSVSVAVAPSTAVPEPGVGVLVIAGLLGLALARRWLG